MNPINPLSALLIIMVAQSHINLLHKRLLYLLIISLIIYINRVESFSNMNNIKNTNAYPIKSYNNVEKLTFNFYEKNYKALLSNNRTDIILEKYAWPSTFSTQSQDYLDKTRFLETDKPIPTNADFF